METEVNPMPGFGTSPDMQKVAHPSQPQTDQGSPVGKDGICSVSSHTNRESYSHGWGGVGVVVVILVNQFSDDGDVSVFIPSQ